MIKTQQDSAKKRRVPWRDFFIAIGIFVLVIIGFIFYLSYQGDDKPIRKVASQLKVDPGWKLVTDVVRPPANMCIDVECPSVHRKWETKVPLTKSDFKALIEQSGWNMSFEEICEDYPHRVSSCWANGSVGEFSVRLIVDIDNTGSVTLFVDN